MNELDHKRDQQAKAVALTLWQALKDNFYFEGEDSPEEALRELLTIVLLGEADRYPCHDWIGEALRLREAVRGREHAIGELITFYEACPDCRNASYETDSGGEKVRCRACNRLYWHARDEPTTGIAGREQEIPANGYVMLSEPLVKHDEGAYIKRGSLDALICEYTCGGDTIYELGVELKPVREVRWVEVRDDD